MKRHPAPLALTASLAMLSLGMLSLGILSLGILASGCGAASASGPSPTANANAPHGAQAALEITPIGIALNDTDALVVGEDGALRFRGDAVGAVRADGRVVTPEGAELAALDADGAITYRGERTPLRIEGDRLRSSVDDASSVAVAPPGGVELRGRDDDVLDRTSVSGITGSNHRLVLFMVAFAILESGHRTEAPTERRGGDGEDDDSVADVERVRVPVDGAPSRGPADALVTIVVFSDFQCPFCGRVVPTLEQLSATYGSDLRIVFRHNPLPFHPYARAAAEAAMEAYAEGGDAAFFRMHDLLFEHQDELDEGSLGAYAAELGLDPDRFARALAGHVHEAAIDADIALADRVGVRGTPTSFVNGRRLVGAQPLSEFQRAVDAELASARARVAAGTPRAALYATLMSEASDAAAPAPSRPRGGSDIDLDHRYDIAVPAGAPSRGRANAPVTIQIFSDFQCPFCQRLVPTLERIRERYGSQVRLVFRHYPLPFHYWARDAAELAVEVQRQRGDAAFWQFFDLVFEHQSEITSGGDPPEALLALAARIGGFDARRGRRALESHAHAAVVDADIAAGRQIEPPIGTPTTFVNGIEVSGARPLEDFERAIDRALETATAPR